MISSELRHKILIISYSFSGQTSNLLRALQQGAESQGIQVEREKLIPQKYLKFPTSGYLTCVKMMFTTFLRRRVPIKELSKRCAQEFDLIILAGPTWSYNPSGPVLAFLDRDGHRLLGGKEVLPLISCRGYWRAHWFGLRRILKRCGARVSNRIVFSHPNREPWRTIGVFCKIAGKNPERSPIFGRVYKKFGHSKLQQQEAKRFGELIGQALLDKRPLEEIDFQSPIALP